MQQTRMKGFFYVVLAVVISIPTVRAQASPRPDAMIAKWTELNSLCRGGSGDDPRTFQACDARDKLARLIDKEGWCYGKNGQLGYEFEWHACTKNSNRPA